MTDYATLTDIYLKYVHGAPVDPQDCETVKKLAASDRLELYFEGGTLCARSPYR